MFLNTCFLFIHVCEAGVLVAIFVILVRKLEHGVKNSFVLLRFVGDVPFVLIVGDQVVVHKDFCQKEVQFAVVGLFVEPQAINFLDKRQDLLALEGWTDIFWPHAQLSFSNFDELV